MNHPVILSGASTERSEVIAQSKDAITAWSGAGVSGNSPGAVVPAKHAVQEECLAASDQRTAAPGSFDSAAASLHEAAAPLRMTVCAALAVIALLALAGCRQDMHDQPRFKPLAQSDFYSDLRSARTPVEGTVARGQLHEDAYFYSGKIGNNPGDYMPFSVTEEVLARGRERFNIYCAPCHSRLGDGNGMIVQRGYKPPPSYHIERLRKAPLGYFFDVISNGFGAMPDYASQIPARDRWCITAYIKALQLSQNATAADIPGGHAMPSQPPIFEEPGSGATLPVEAPASTRPVTTEEDEK